MESLLDLPIREAAARISSGALEAETYAAAFSERRRALNEELNAFISLEQRPSGAAGGPLRGIPVGIKDNIETESLPTTCASRILEGYVAPRDATVVSRLLDAGADVAGKANLDEFAMGSSNEHSAFGVCRNPWNPTRVPGGSSGGSAAAVAAGMVPVALGSDTGGSVRQPAAFCGLVGIKPTYGRVSRSGLVAFASSLDQVGVLGRRVDDVALVLEVIAGRDVHDATSVNEKVEGYDRPGNLRGRRIGVIEQSLEGLASNIRANFDSAVEHLVELGAEVDRVSLSTLPYSIATYYIIANAEASANLARFDGVRYGRRAEGASSLEELYLRSRTEGFGEEVKRRIMLGTFALSSGYYDAYYGRAQLVREAIRRQYDQALESHDYLLTPTTPEPAFELGAKDDDLLSMYLSDIMTASANLSGHPAIALPSGLDEKSGMPLSIQLIGRRFDEAGLFEAGRAFESSTRFFERRPPISA